MATLEVIDLLASMFYTVFGNGYILALVLATVVILTVLAMRGNLAVILILLVPLFIGFVVNASLSNFLEFPTWVLLVTFMLLGLVFAGFFLFFIKWYCFERRNIAKRNKSYEFQFYNNGCNNRFCSKFA